METSSGLVSATSAVRSPRSTVPAKSWRLTLKRAGPPSRLTTTSFENGTPPDGGLISMRQSAGPVERNPSYRSRTTVATSGSRVTTAVRRPAIPMLNSTTEGSSHKRPQPEKAKASGPRRPFEQPRPCPLREQQQERRVPVAGVPLQPAEEFVPVHDRP